MAPDIYTALLALSAEPRSAYTVDSDILERVRIAIRALYGGGPCDARVTRLADIDHEVSAVLRARASLDRDTMPITVPPAPVPDVVPPTRDGGTRVPVIPRPPTKPMPSTAVDLFA